MIHISCCCPSLGSQSERGRGTKSVVVADLPAGATNIAAGAKTEAAAAEKSAAAAGTAGAGTAAAPPGTIRSTGPMDLLRLSQSESKLSLQKVDEPTEE